LQVASNEAAHEEAQQLVAVKIISTTLNTLISCTSTEISVSKPRRTCNEDSKSSVMPILAWFGEEAARNLHH